MQRYLCKMRRMCEKISQTLNISRGRGTILRLGCLWLWEILINSAVPRLGQIILLDGHVRAQWPRCPPLANTWEVLGRGPRPHHRTISHEKFIQKTGAYEKCVNWETQTWSQTRLLGDCISMRTAFISVCWFWENNFHSYYQATATVEPLLKYDAAAAGNIDIEPIFCHNIPLPILPCAFFSAFGSEQKESDSHFHMSSVYFHHPK